MSTVNKRQIESAEQLCAELARCSQLTEVLLDDLQELLSEPIDHHDTRWIENVLDELCELVDDEFQLRAKGGYLHEVLDEFPSWDRQVEQLKQEHDQLRQELRQLRASFQRPLSSKRISRVARQEFRDWFERLSSHKQDENAIILKAHTLDVGQGE